MKHMTTWEDGGIAGFECLKNGEWVGGGVADTEEESECLSCGKRIKLIWNVKVVEV